jgi:beta-glucanase (GH16 family)
MSGATSPVLERTFHDVPLKLLWCDEFDGTTLNRDYWNVEINGSGCGNNELQNYIDSPENVAVEDGNLVLTAMRRNSDGHAFTSGRVNTHDKFTFTYGLVEARIKLPVTTNGLWPAFWMMGNDISQVGWPKCGEIDILEMGHADGIANDTQARLFNGALHYGNHGHLQQVAPCVNDYSLQDGCYHTFYLWWTPDALEMYVDSASQPYLRVDISDKENSDLPGYYFDKPNFLLVNLAVGGDFPGIHDPAGISALPAYGDSSSMYVDYIRIYTPEIENQK